MWNSGTLHIITSRFLLCTQTLFSSLSSSFLSRCPGCALRWQSFQGCKAWKQNLLWLTRTCDITVIHIVRHIGFFHSAINSDKYLQVSFGDGFLFYSELQVLHFPVKALWEIKKGRLAEQYSSLTQCPGSNRHCRQSQQFAEVTIFVILVETHQTDSSPRKSSNILSNLFLFLIKRKLRLACIYLLFVLCTRHMHVCIISDFRSRNCFCLVTSGS